MLVKILNRFDGNVIFEWAKCQGCGVELTFENLGGYRAFCEKCVDAIPEMPEGFKGGNVEGKYPNFEWVENES